MVTIYVKHDLCKFYLYIPFWNTVCFVHYHCNNPVVATCPATLSTLNQWGLLVQMTILPNILSRCKNFLFRWYNTTTALTPELLRANTWLNKTNMRLRRSPFILPSQKRKESLQSISTSQIRLVATRKCPSLQVQTWWLVFAPTLASVRSTEALQGIEQAGLSRLASHDVTYIQSTMVQELRIDHTGLVALHNTRWRKRVTKLYGDIQNY